MGKPIIRFRGYTDDWEQRKLSEITSVITKGTTPLDKSGNGNINFIKIENIDSRSGEIIPEMKITEEEHNGYLKRSQLQENDILFSIAGTLGRVSIIKSSVLPANTNQALAIIRTKEGDLRYLTTVLKGNAVADFIKKNPTIGAQPNLSLEQVGNLEIPYPFIVEQEAIGKYFSNLDHLITLHQHKFSSMLKSTLLTPYQFFLKSCSSTLCQPFALPVPNPSHEVHDKLSLESLPESSSRPLNSVYYKTIDNMHKTLQSNQA